MCVYVYEIEPDTKERGWIVCVCVCVCVLERVSESESERVYETEYQSDNSI